MQLNPEDLQISSLETTEERAIGPGGGYCCTGCVSGCGINPTAGGCASGGQSFDKFACYQQDAGAAAL
jgi:hypothetical protein